MRSATTPSLRATVPVRSFTAHALFLASRVVDAPPVRKSRGAGELFFVKVRTEEGLRRFQPLDAAAALEAALSQPMDRKTVVISHHAPSLKGLNPAFAGNRLDGAYASDLEAMIERLSSVPVWVHGHTHIKRAYRTGETVVRVNCRGFEKLGGSVKGFIVKEAVEI